MNKRTPVCLVLKSAVLLVTLLCVFPLFATNPQKKEMKELNVKKVSLANVAVENIPALLDKEKVAFQSINTVNWKAFPYQPEVQFRIALDHQAQIRQQAGEPNAPENLDP